MNNTSVSINPTFQDENGVINGVRAVSDGQYAITVRHARIQYTDVVGSLVSNAASKINVVLEDFNMTIKKGHIYGLLGPSGCGKTSILKAIVGRLDLTAGEIRVLGRRPNTPKSGIPGTTIGYMPQDLCLLEELTIRESLQFYGKLVGMTSDEIDAKCGFFVKLLDLPDSNRTVRTLSGGQQRRVSFAIAVLHSPPILILDEPTVGVDSLLRESIWKYLVKVARCDDTTVLITTHYIEEATQTDNVGLMRNGRLMAEESPALLIQSLQCNTLEEAILKLATVQSTKKDFLKTVNDAHDLPELPTINIGEANTASESSVWTEISSLQRILVLAWKDVLIVRRNPGFILLMLLLPVVCISLVCLSFGRNPKGLNISIFNEESNCSSPGYIPTDLYDDKSIINCSIPNFLSCNVLKVLQELEITTIISDSRDSAENDVRRGRSWAAITFSKNFTSALMRRSSYSSIIHVEDDDIDKGVIQVVMDESDLIISNFLQQQMAYVMKRVLSDVDDVCHNMRHTKDVPMSFKPPIYGQGADYLDSTLPGIIVSMVNIYPCGLAVAELLPPLIQGTIERGLIAGVKMREVIVSQFIIALIPSLIITTEIIAIPYLLFGRVMVGSFWTVAGLAIPLMVSGILLGFILSLISKLLSVAFVTVMFLYLAFLLTSGTVWPIEGAYSFAQPFFWMSPLSLTVDGFRQVAMRGWTVGYKSLQLALTSLGFWILAYLAILALILRFRR